MKCLYTGAADLIALCLEGLTADNKSCAVSYLDFCIQESRNQQVFMKTPYYWLHIYTHASGVDDFENFWLEIWSTVSNF